DSAVEEISAPTPRGWPWYAALVVGSVGLFGAALMDTVAVFGRHVGFGFLGSIELSQAFVCLVASGSIVLATLSATHATVHMVTDRLGERGRLRLRLFADLLFVLTFAAIIAGGIWVLADMWPGAEQSELLHLPYKPLRLLWLVALTGVLLGVLYELRAALRHA
ncbi:MAG: TRAP transporter small permease, partial [Allosphingosinicella sp.]